MGGALTALERDHPPTHIDFAKAENWRMNHVQALHQHFKQANLEFAMNIQEFGEFLQAALPQASESSKILWGKFDPAKEGFVNVLEVMSGLAIMGRGSISEKLQLLWAMHDFNSVGNLSYDELVVLLFIAASSTVLLSAKGTIPEERFIEAIADEAFVSADIDITGRINYSGFLHWFLDYLQITEETPTVGLREFLKRMQCMKQKEVTATAGQLALQRQAQQLGVASGGGAASTEKKGS
mmetsp:Transcript_28587/g.83678  ORF Transcript_28587/g.83678 Transcript_28587/m.83678 type:complete len:239 (-) Transcript_28587:59-775(-)